MSASNNFITRPVLSTVCSLLIVIVGLIAIPILPIENLPDIAPPTVKVQALVFFGGVGQVLNIYAQVGLVMLIGLAVGNAILMTPISSLTGFLPLMLARGAGDQSQSSLALVVFGGLLVATFLSTLVVPVFYVVMKTLLGAADAKPPADGPTPTPQPS